MIALTFTFLNDHFWALWSLIVIAILAKYVTTFLVAMATFNQR